MKRIYHRWEKWECVKSGFFDTEAKGMNADQARVLYAEFLGSKKRFEKGLKRVLAEWKFTCEHFLSNESLNRIAFLGQAAMNIETGVPSIFRAGFKLLSVMEQEKADRLANRYLKVWEKQNAKIG